MMRIGLFLATNLAVLFVLNLLITVLGLNQPGMNWLPLISTLRDPCIAFMPMNEFAMMFCETIT